MQNFAFSMEKGGDRWEKKLNFCYITNEVGMKIKDILGNE